MSVHRCVVAGLVFLGGCGGEPAPDGYERWSGSGATFVYPEDWEEEDRPVEFKEAGLKFVAGSDTARVLVIADKGRSLDAFMAEALGTAWFDYDLSLGPRERIEVPGAETAVRREAKLGEGGGAMNWVFASRKAESHVALAVAGEVDEEPILESFALD